MQVIFNQSVRFGWAENMFQDEFSIHFTKWHPCAFKFASFRVHCQEICVYCYFQHLTFQYLYIFSFIDFLSFYDFPLKCGTFFLFLFTFINFNVQYMYILINARVDQCPWLVMQGRSRIWYHDEINGAYNLFLLTHFEVSDSFKKKESILIQYPDILDTY